MIGCGGSGSKAVRYARDAVTRRLREVGWTDPMPGAWTFLGLDFDRQRDTAEIPPLPEHDFVGLSGNFEKYRELYDTLLHSYPPDSDEYRQHLLGWLPEGDADISLDDRGWAVSRSWAGCRIAGTGE